MTFKNQIYYNQMRYFQILIPLFLFVLSSCNDGNRCYESVDTLMMGSFTINDAKTINTLTIKGINRNLVGDTLVNYATPTTIVKATIPLSLSADSTGFVIVANNRKDTIFVRHTMIIKLISENCGFAPNYNISGVRFTAGIDSVKITDGEVNPKSIEKTTNDQNISIYFNPAVH